MHFYKFTSHADYVRVGMVVVVNGYLGTLSTTALGRLRPTPLPLPARCCL